MAVDLAVPLRTAVIGHAPVTAKLSAYKGSWPVFTRRPAPADATPPYVMVSPDISSTNQDGINDERPVLVRDISVYGMNDTPAKYVTVEEIGYLLHHLFHSQRLSITVPGWHVIQITSRGPIPVPADDDKMVGRMVSLTIELARSV